MRKFQLLWFFAFVLAGSTMAQVSPYVIEEGGQTNVFLDDDRTQAHVLLRDGRLVLAFPAENSGMGVWFDGEMELLPDSLSSLPSGPNSQALRVDLHISKSTVVRKVVLDSIRTLRDESEGVKTADALEKARGSGQSEDLLALGSGAYKARFRREQRFVAADAGPFELELSPCRRDSDGNVLLEVGTVTVTARLPFKPMQRFLPAELYQPDYLETVSRSPGRVDDSLRALEFLVRREKMMAGSWRFLTYFGRDTLISLAMLEPILSDQALKSGIDSVLQRLSPDGMVAHEEDIGPWAEWRHLQAGESKGLEPVFDHKMIDDDLLLPVLLAKLQENGRGDVLNALLRDPKSREAILRNADYVLGLLSKRTLIRLNPGESTGDWRDSHEGLGGGVYPASVNADLALPSLDALIMLYGSTGAPKRLEQAKALRPIWKKLAASYWIELSPDQVRSRLDSFAATLRDPQKATFNTLMRARPDLLEAPFRFPVLAFNDDMSPVIVPHTDVAFTLFYGHPSQEQLDATLSLLERPFPYGLATPAGPLVASPVFSADPGHYRSLGFGQYHGLVVWSWPSAMLQFGLLRQQGRFPALDSRIGDVLTQIRQSEERVGPLATSELWAVGLDGGGITWRAYGVAGDQAESNALQLWSTVYPALQYVRDRSN